MKNHTQTKMAFIPACNLCKGGTIAYADAALPKHGGSWAYVCLKHFKECGCSLGLGRGQELIEETP